MLALVVNAVIIDDTCVKNVGENLVDRTFGKRIAAIPLLFPCSRPEILLVRGDLQNPRRRITAGEHQVPHLADERKSVEVFDDGLFHLVVQITEGSHIRPPSFLHLALDAPLNVFSQIYDVLVRHPTLNAKKQ